jgi:hypothetical protein
MCYQMFMLFQYFNVFIQECQVKLLTSNDWPHSAITGYDDFQLSLAIYFYFSFRDGRKVAFLYHLPSMYVLMACQNGRP